MNEYDLRKTMISCMDDKEIRSIIFNKKKERAAIRIEDFKFQILERLSEIIKLPFEMVCNAYLSELRSECDNAISILEKELKYRSGWFERDDLDALKQEVSIVDVVSHYIPGFSSRNINSNIICPFHEERSPSLHVYVKTNTWRCFWCNKWGTSIDFIAYSDKCNIAQAIKKLKQFI